MMKRAASSATAPWPARSKRAMLTASGKTVQGNWVVGDNPRVIYFPYILPQRRYTVRLAAELPAADGSALRESAHCQVDTDAMPPSLLFRQPRRRAAGRPEWWPAGCHGQYAGGRCAVPAHCAGTRPGLFRPADGQSRPSASGNPDDEDNERRLRQFGVNEGSRQRLGSGSLEDDRVQRVPRAAF